MKKYMLVTGSLAYDVLYKYPGVFSTRLKQTRTPISIAFNVENKSEHFGGCAGNIAYNGALLGEHFKVIGIAGKDFEPYEKRLKSFGIDTKDIIQNKNNYTSHALVSTDTKGDQLTFFYEGAAGEAKKYAQIIDASIKRLSKSLIFAHIAPNGKDFTIACIKACSTYKIPFIFDPGQTLPLYSKQELKKIVKKAYGLFFNENEFELFKKQSGLTLDELKAQCYLIVITYGARGSKIITTAFELSIKAVKPKKVLDPTGCGDAYRAAFLATIKSHFPHLSKQVLKEAGDKASLLASKCAATVGTQSHQLS